MYSDIHELVVTGVIKELKSLKPKLTSKNPKYRIQFAIKILVNGLYDRMMSHELFDYGLSGRDFDACFEMNDGSEVVHGIVSEALHSKQLEFAVRELGPKVWDSWHQTYQDLNKQQDLFSHGDGVEKVPA